MHKINDAQEEVARVAFAGNPSKLYDNPNKIPRAALAKEYKKQTGQDLPSKDQREIIEKKWRDVMNKKIEHEKKHPVITGEDRRTNWVIQMEEI